MNQFHIDTRVSRPAPNPGPPRMKTPARPSAARRARRRAETDLAHRAVGCFQRIIAGCARPLLAAVLLGASPGASAQVIQPLNEAESKDAKIYGTLPTLSLQSDLNVVSQDVGAHFLALLQFDLTAITLAPADITGATLTLYSTGLGLSGGPAVGGTVTVSPILNEWRETAGSPGTAPLATYNAFFGTGTAQTLSFGPAVASQNVTGAGFVEWDITNLVKSWKEGTQQNHGVLLQISSNGGDIGFADVDSAPGVAGSQPRLTVVPEPGVGLLAISGMSALLFHRRRRS